MKTVPISYAHIFLLFIKYNVIASTSIFTVLSTVKSNSILRSLTLRFVFVLLCWRDMFHLSPLERGHEFGLFSSSCTSLSGCVLPVSELFTTCLQTIELRGNKKANNWQATTYQCVMLIYYTWKRKILLKRNKKKIIIYNRL